MRTSPRTTRDRSCASPMVHQGRGPRRSLPGEPTSPRAPCSRRLDWSSSGSSWRQAGDRGGERCSTRHLAAVARQALRRAEEQLRVEFAGRERSEHARARAPGARSSSVQSAGSGRSCPPPIIPITDRIMVSAADRDDGPAAGAAGVSTALQGVESSGAEVVIIDITGVKDGRRRRREHPDERRRRPSGCSGRRR